MTSRGSEKLKTNETKKVKKIVLFDSLERPTTGDCVTAATAYSALSKGYERGFLNSLNWQFLNSLNFEQGWFSCFRKSQF